MTLCFVENFKAKEALNTLDGLVEMKKATVTLFKVVDIYDKLEKGFNMKGYDTILDIINAKVEKKDIEKHIGVV